jgi:lysyl-tRNA synthetase class 1
MFWAEELARKIIKEKGKKIVVATAITPSGDIHIGNMREVLTADFVVKELKKIGAKVRFVYIADDFDRLRKVYPFLPKNYIKYVGWPLVNIPDPVGKCHKSYAEHFISPFFAALDKLGINVEKLSAYKMYRSGFYTETVRTALEKKDEIKKILQDVSGRELPKDWSPFNPLCKACGKIDEAKVIKEDLEHNKVKYICSCGESDWADYSRGEGKLAWRIDWPARWSKIPVDVEPFGKEHATQGGSYDTGALIVKKVFKHDAPFPVPYDLLYLRGYVGGKMSSSLGNVISADDFLKVMPPEILRYMFARVKYNRHFYIDMKEDLLRLADEYNHLAEKVERNDASKEDKTIFDICQVKRKGKIVPSIPFKHLANTVQAAQNNTTEIKRILVRTGFKNSIKDDNFLGEQIKRANLWIEKYAPDNFRFTISKTTPKVELSNGQKQLLSQIASELSKKDFDAESLHNYIYESGKEIGLKPKETFEAVYLAILGKPSGPKAGWFLVLLDKNFIVERFKEISK